MTSSRHLILAPLPLRERKGPVAQRREGEGYGVATRLVVEKAPPPSLPLEGGGNHPMNLQRRI
jgi:hypothetical protein